MLFMRKKNNDKRGKLTKVIKIDQKLYDVLRRIRTVYAPQKSFTSDRTA